MKANALFFSLVEGVITALAAESGVNMSFFLLEPHRPFFLTTGVEGGATAAESSCDSDRDLSAAGLAGVHIAVGKIGRLAVCLRVQSAGLVPFKPPSPSGGKRM